MSTSQSAQSRGDKLRRECGELLKSYQPGSCPPNQEERIEVSAGWVFGPANEQMRVEKQNMVQDLKQVLRADREAFMRQNVQALENL
jgi:hypothetical protein